jgi:WD40 repeat protein
MSCDDATRLVAVSSCRLTQIPKRGFLVRRDQNMISWIALFKRGLPISRGTKRKFVVAIGALALVCLMFLYSCLDDRSPRVDPGRPTALKGHHFPVRALAFGPDGATLKSAASYLGASVGGIEVASWNVRTGQLEMKHVEYPGALYALRCLTFAPGGQRLAATFAEREVVLWDVVSCRECARLAVPGLSGKTIAFADDEAQLATTDCIHGVPVWDARDGHERFFWNVQLVSSLAFAPGGALVACATSDCTVRLWSPATGEESCLRPVHQHGVYALAFSPDSRQLASGDFGGTVKLWDVAAKTLRAPLTVSEDRDEVVTLVFSPDGWTLAVAVDRAVQLWDVATGRRVARLEGHHGKVKCLAFSPDGKRLASGSYDTTVRLWDVARPRKP